MKRLLTLAVLCLPAVLEAQPLVLTLPELAPQPPAAAPTIPRTKKDLVQVTGSAWVFTQVSVGRGPALQGTAFISGTAPVSGSNAHGDAWLNGWVTVSGAGTAGTGYVSGFVNLTGTAPLYDKDGKLLGTAFVTATGFVSGYANNGFGTISGQLAVRGTL
jgi:hypothetical protein